MVDNIINYMKSDLKVDVTEVINEFGDYFENVLITDVLIHSIYLFNKVRRGLPVSSSDTWYMIIFVYKMMVGYDFIDTRVSVCYLSRLIKGCSFNNYVKFELSLLTRLAWNIEVNHSDYLDMKRMFGVPESEPECDPADALKCEPLVATPPLLTPTPPLLTSTPLLA